MAKATVREYDGRRLEYGWSRIERYQLGHFRKRGECMKTCVVAPIVVGAFLASNFAQAQTDLKRLPKRKRRASRCWSCFAECPDTPARASTNRLFVRTTNWKSFNSSSCVYAWCR